MAKWILDRSTQWTFAQMNASLEDARVVRVWENPLAQKLTEVDLAKVELLPLIAGGYFSQSMTEKSFNDEILSRLKAIENQGYVLLDGAVVVAMLKEKQKIPPLWGKITETESADEQSGIIRFDGSIFQVRDSSAECILAPHTTRGFWNFGYNTRFPRFPKKEDLTRTMINRELTAAIKL